MKDQHTTMKDLATLAQSRARLMNALDGNKREIYNVVTDNMQVCLDNGFITIDYARIMRRLSD